LDRKKFPHSDIPAVTHVDYSARVHTVGLEAQPRFRALLERLRETTGHGIVINTSFNVRGEPIVCTPEDAIACYLRTGMDCLFIGGWMAEKPAS
jgi:carbamoyltransferase